jgi:hypothetical protein
MCLLGSFGAFLWQVDGGWGPTGLGVEAFAGLWSMGLACLKGAGQQSGDPVCLWSWLDRLGEHGPAEWRSCVCGSPALQALGAQACGVNIVQGCAGLGGMAQQKWRSWGFVSPAAGFGGVYWQSRDHTGLCRPGSQGAWPGGDVNVCGSLALRARPTEILLFWGVGVWGNTALVGQRSRAGGSENPQCMEQWLRGPMGQGFLSVYGGMERPLTS